MSKAVAPISMHVDWVWGKPDWARLQDLLVLTRARIGVGQAKLGHGISLGGGPAWDRL